MAQSRLSRSKSTDVDSVNASSCTVDASSCLEELKQTLRESSQLLMKTMPVMRASDTSVIKEEEEDEAKIVDASTVPLDASRSTAWVYGGTLFVRKRVRVQSSVDALYRIRDCRVNNVGRPPNSSRSGSGETSNATSSLGDITSTQSSELSERSGEISEDAAENPLGTCQLSSESVGRLDGTRVLTRVGAHFYPGRATAVEPPFIFAVR